MAEHLHSLSVEQPWRVLFHCGEANRSYGDSGTLRPIGPCVSSHRASRMGMQICMIGAITDPMPLQPETARDFIRRMRDEDRY